MDEKLTVSPISLINAIKKKHLNVKNLTEEQKLVCIELMDNEGFSGAELAEFLKVSTRTIRRYKAKIRQQNAVKIGPNFKAEQLGYILQRAQAAISHLHKISKESNCSHSVKARAIKDTWTIIKEQTTLLQSLGCMPYHNPTSNNQVEIPTLTDLSDEIDQLGICLQQDDKCDDQMKQEIVELKNTAAKLELSDKISHFQDKIAEDNNDDNSE